MTNHWVPEMKWRFEYDNNATRSAAGIGKSLPFDLEAESGKKLVVQWGGRLQESTVQLLTSKCLFITKIRDPNMISFQSERLNKPKLRWALLAP